MQSIIKTFLQVTWDHCPLLLQRPVSPLKSATAASHMLNSSLRESAAGVALVAVMQWVKDQHPLFCWSENASNSADAGGQLEVLQWLRSQSPPCPWSHRTCESAVWFGHLGILQWLRNQDGLYPRCKEGCVRTAAQSGQLEILKWLRSQDPPCPWNDTQVRGQLGLVTLRLCSGLEAKSLLVCWVRIYTGQQLDKVSCTSYSGAGAEIPLFHGVTAHAQQQLKSAKSDVTVAQEPGSSLSMGCMYNGSCK